MQALESVLNPQTPTLNFGKKANEVKLLKVATNHDNIKTKIQSPKQLLSLKAQISAQKPVDAVSSQLKAAESDVKVWEVRKDYTEITSPVNGIISAKFQEENNKIGVQAPIYNIEDNSLTRLITAIPQEHAFALKPGQTMLINDKDDYGFKITRIHPVLNGLRQITLEAQISGKPQELIYDMQIPVKIVTQSVSIIIPPKPKYTDFKDPADSMFIKSMTIWLSEPK